MTDAALDADDGPGVARPLPSNDSFNCISVDGHMSTNDTVLLLANGAAGGAPLAGADLDEFQQALERSVPANWPARFRPTAKGPRT